jgi:hypothetical protein
MREHLACNVAPSGNLIGMWERGEVRPGRSYRRGLTEFTGLTEADLGLVPAQPLTGSTRSSAEEEDTKRRELMTSAIAAGVALSGFPLPARAGTPGRIRPDDIAELRQLTQTYRAWVY